MRQVNVSVSEEMDDLLGELASALGVGRATLVRHVLEQSAPYLRELLALASRAGEDLPPPVLRLLISGMCSSEEAARR